MAIQGPPPPGIPPMGPGGIKGPGDKKGEGGKVEGREGKAEPRSAVGRGVYELDASAIAARMAALAEEIRRHNIPMEKVIEEAIARTGITNPQAAMEEVNKITQQEIEKILDEIKQNKELMEEAEAWQSLGELLEQKLTDDQIRKFLMAMEAQIKGWNG